MLRLSDVRTLLLQEFPLVSIYNGTIDKNNPNCFGIFTREPVIPVALGGYSGSSYSNLNVSILVHWGEDTDACESLADDVFYFLHCKGPILVNGKTITSILAKGPIDISRDENNICEMVVHADIMYTR